PQRTAASSRPRRTSAISRPRAGVGARATSGEVPTRAGTVADMAISATVSAAAAPIPLPISGTRLPHGWSQDTIQRELVVKRPALPEWLGELTLRGLSVGAARVDLRFRRIAGQSRCRLTHSRLGR